MKVLIFDYHPFPILRDIAEGMKENTFTTFLNFYMVFVSTIAHYFIVHLYTVLYAN